MERPWEKEPLTKLSIVIILLLDIFVFSLIFSGIQKQKDIVDTPSEYASYSCINTIEQYSKIENPNQRLQIVEGIYNSYLYNKNSGYSSSQYSYTGYGNKIENTSASPVCTNIEVMLDRIRSDLSLSTVFQVREILLKKSSTNQASINSLTRNYDTKLLEKIAEVDPSTTLTPGTAESTKSNLEILNNEKGLLEADLVRNTSEIIASPIVQEIVKLVRLDGPGVVLKHEQLSFWYPIKTFAVQSLFLIPLLIIIGVWSSISLRRGRTYQVLVASHILVVLSIFVLLRIIELIYDLIPHTFFAKLFTLLENFNIIGLWYYALVALAIGGTLGMIYLIQRRVKRAAELQASQIGAKRAEHGNCWSCGAHLPNGATHCIRCGETQESKCHSCGGMTSRAGEHCKHCWVERIGEKLKPSSLQKK
jgi:ribosomal protein L40E